MIILSESVLQETGLSTQRRSSEATENFALLALRDLQIRLKALHRALRSAVARQSIRPNPGAEEQAVSQLCVTPEDAEAMLIELDALSQAAPELGALAMPTDLERRQLEELRQTVQAQEVWLPIERLKLECSLSDFEIDVVLLCAASEMDRGYARLFGYIVDDMNRQAPSIELFCRLGLPGLPERLARRNLLGRSGRLRRCGLLRASEESSMPARTQLALSEGVIERLTQPGTWRDRFYDSAVIDPSPGISLEGFEQQDLLSKLARQLGEGKLHIGALWGERASGVDDAVLAVAAVAGMPLHKLPLQAARLDDELAAAQARGALVWIGTDALGDHEITTPEFSKQLIDRLSRTATPVCLSGTKPWRPTALLAERDYAEIRLRPASGKLRERLWCDRFDTLDRGQARDLAARFRLNPTEVRGVARVARAQAELQGHGNPLQGLDEACRQVTQWQTLKFATRVEPRRGAEDLILPSDLHRQVLEVARFYRSLLQVDENWGFNRLGHGGGIKVLFTGDSGTGKTLAAEVIAG
jgi:hypothetical protein